MRKKTRWFLVSIPKDQQFSESEFKELLSKTMKEMFGVFSYLYSIKIVYFSIKLGYTIVNCNREISNYLRLCTILAQNSGEMNIPCSIVHTSGTLCSIQKKLTDILVNEEIFFYS